MRTFLIESRDSGHVYGEYEGNTKEAALAALIEDTGSSGDADPGVEDLHFTEMNGACTAERVAITYDAAQILRGWTTRHPHVNDVTEDLEASCTWITFQDDSKLEVTGQSVIWYPC